MPLCRYYAGEAPPYSLMGESRVLAVQLAPHPTAAVALAESWHRLLLPRAEVLSAIVAVIESRVGARPEELSSDEFELAPCDTVRFPCLAHESVAGARDAVRTVHAFNEAAAPLLPLVNPDYRGVDESPGHTLMALKGLLWYSRKARALQGALRATDVQARASPVHFNRMRAVAVGEEAAASDTPRRASGEGTLFWQAFEVRAACASRADLR